MSIVKSEFLKLRKSKPFYVCLLLCVAVAALLAFAFQQGINKGESEFAGMAESLSGIQMIGNSISLVNFHIVICAVFVSIFVSGEFQHGTMKNYISKGFNRVQIYLSKLAVCSVAVLSMFIVYIAAACIGGTLMWGFDPNGVFSFGGFITMLGTQMLLTLAYTAVFVAVGMVFKSNGSSIAINIVAVTLLPTLLMALNLIVGNNIDFANYWISGNVSALATLSPASSDVLRGVIVGAVYLVGMTILGGRLFQTQDVK